MTVNEIDRTSDLGCPKLDWQESGGGGGEEASLLGEEGSSYVKVKALLRADTVDGIWGARVF